MSIRKFIGSNSLSNSRILFNERAKYRNEAISKRLQAEYPGVFRDFWFIENMYYGKINRLHEFMIPKESKIKTVQLDGGESLFVLDFVADAINGFLKSYDQALNNGKISRQDQVLSSLVPVKGYTNVLFDYEKNVRLLRDTIHPILIEKEKQIHDFESFVDLFMEMLFENYTNNPFTLTGFVSSKLSPLSMTGLFVEMSNLDYGKDQEKITELIDKPSYTFFIKNCAKHGFLIDVNVPWRICANIGSLEMESYMAKYDSNKDKVFNDYYDVSYNRDIEYMMNYLLSFYNRFVTFRPFIQNEKVDGFNIHRYVTRRKKLTKEELDFKYDNKFRLNLYIDLRNRETNSRYKKALINKIKNNAMGYLDSLGMQSAMSYIDQQFKGFLNDRGAYNSLNIASELELENAQASGQDLQEVLDRSVAESRKTIY